MKLYSDQQYNPDIGHLCVSIYHQAAAGQSLTLGLRLPILRSPNI